MELTGEQILPLPRERVWAALNDPEILKASVPGCESFERVDENQFQMVMAASVGPIKARFKGKMTLTDLQPPQSYSLTFEGSGGAAGFGKGGARVDLLPEGVGTKLVYKSHAQVGGRLAQVGARLIDGVAKKMAEDFFGRFTAAVTGPQTQVEDDGAMIGQPGDARRSTPMAGSAIPGASAATQRGADDTRATGNRKVWLWAAGAILVVAAAAAYTLH
jgi:carbon monoxide dehydrogenase subunit G